MLNRIRQEYVSIDEELYFNCISTQFSQLLQAVNGEDIRKLEIILRPSLFGLIDNGLGLLLFVLLEADSPDEGRNSLRASVTIFPQDTDCKRCFRSLEIPFLNRWEALGKITSLL